MRVSILGPMRLHADDESEIPPPTAPKERALLSLLALRTGSVVPTSEIVSRLWGEEPPRTAVKAVQTYVSSLRHRLPSGTIESVSNGYRLPLAPDHVDAIVFERAVLDGITAAARSELNTAMERLTVGLNAWRGEPLVELADQPGGSAEALGLRELRLAGQEALADARLAMGEHVTMVPELESDVAAEPLRERRWAQLMLALYRSGRQADALRAYQRLRTLLGEELGIEPSTELRQLEEAILLQKPELDVPEDQGLVRRRRVMEAARPHNDLPAEGSSLVGRDELVGAVRDLVGAERLVTLVGPAGVGKTRVALRAARQSCALFRDGAAFVGLLSAGSGTLVSDLILSRLGSQPFEGEGPGDAIVRALRASQLLLVLDNCEHVIGDVAEVASRIVEECPNIHLLLTSRRPVGLPIERRVSVPPLEFPAEGVTAAVAGDAAAVDLFCVRAAATDPEFRLTDRNVVAVVDLCAALGGLPFAIELVAGRLDVETVEDLARDAGSSALLERLSRRGGASFASVTASLAWSYDVLAPDEQALLRSLSAFAGSFTREMALALDETTEHPGRALEHLVTVALVSRDLVTPARWRLLEPTKAFCRARMGPTEQERLRRAHAMLMCSRAERYGPLMQTAQQAHASEVFAADLADYRAAMTFLLDDGSGESLAIAARLMVELYAFCHFRIVPDARRWASHLAEVLPEEHPLLAAVCGAAALGSWFEGRMDDAIRFGERAVECSERSRRPVPHWAHIALLDAYGFTGRTDEMASAFQALIAASRADPDPFWQANGLGYEAIGLILVGQTDRAVRRAQEAHRRARMVGNPQCLQWALHCLGMAYATHDPAAASGFFEDAMVAVADVDERWGRILNLGGWVAAQRRMGRADTAAGGVLELIGLLRATGIRSILATILAESAHLLHDRGDDDAAAVALCARVGLPRMPGPTDEDWAPIEEAIREQLGARMEAIAVRTSTWTEDRILEFCAAALEPAATRQVRTITA